MEGTSSALTSIVHTLHSRCAVVTLVLHCLICDLVVKLIKVIIERAVLVMVCLQESISVSNSGCV